MKPAQKHKYNTKTAQIHKTKKQTNKQKKTILQEKTYKGPGANTLNSEETQINLFKKLSQFSANIF
jgi:hypothetical protein